MNPQRMRVLVLTDSFPLDAISESFFSDEGCLLNEECEAIFAPSSYKASPKHYLSSQFTVIKAKEFNGIARLCVALWHFPWLAVAKELWRKPMVLASPRNLFRLLLEALQVGLRIATLGKVGKVDLIYSFWGRSDAVVASILSRKTGAAFAFRNHNFDLYEERFRGYIPFKRYLSGEGGLGIYLSDASALYAKKRFGEAPFVIRPLGANLTVSDLAARPQSLKSFISVSYVSGVKRIGFLAKILSELSLLSEHVISWTHVGGSSEEFSKAVLSVSDSLSRVKVTHLESQQPEIIPSILRNCGAAIFINSSAHEGMPVSILEAMNSQKVIVAPAVGDIPSLLGGSGNLVFDPSHSAESVAAQLLDWLGEVDRTELGAKNATLVRSKFDSKKCAKETVEALIGWGVGNAIRE